MPLLTKDDLQAIGELLNSKIQPLDLKIDRVDRNLTALILGAEKRLDARIDHVEARLEGKIDTLTVHVDGFAKRQLELGAELAAERVAWERLEARLNSA